MPAAPSSSSSSLDPLSIWHLAHELDELLKGAQVQKVQQLGPTLWALHLWWRGLEQRDRLAEGSEPATKLVLHASKDRPFFALLTAAQLAVLPQAPERNNAARQQATGLCMLLRKHLVGAKVARVWAEPGEQLLLVQLAQTNDLGQAVRPVLVLECMGKHTNLLLVDATETGPEGSTVAAGGKILGCQHRVTDAMSRLRAVDTNLPYELPPKPADKPLVTALDVALFARQAEAVGAEAPKQWVDLVLNQGWGVGRGLLRQLVGFGLADSAAGLLAQVQRLHEPTAIAPTLTAGGTFHLLGPQEPGDQAMATVCQVTAHVFVAERVTAACHTLRRQLDKPLQTALAHVRQELERMANQLADTATGDQFRHWGDGLMTAHSMGQLPGKGPTGTVFTFNNPITGKADTIPTDPRFDWTGTAQRLYKQAQREKRRRQMASDQQAQAEARHQQLQELVVWLEQADTLAGMQDLVDDWHTAGLVLPHYKPEAQGTKAAGKPKVSKAKSKSNKAGKGKPTKAQAPVKDPAKGVLKLTFQPMAPLEEEDLPLPVSIWVGRTGQANAALCGKLARGWDWWFHVQGMAGSHVLVRATSSGGEGSEALLPEVIEAAAMLAVHFSVARSSPNVPVVFTQARYVRKIPDSWPGHVTYTHETGLFITVDPARLARLLGESAL